MEFEIFNLPGLLLSVLEGGMRIRAYGWHVQDSAHCEKTELHPVNQILATDGPSIEDATSFTYVHALDWDDRLEPGSSGGGDSQTRNLEVAMLTRHAVGRFDTAGW
jgi:hypothetical protein